VEEVLKQGITLKEAREAFVHGLKPFLQRKASMFSSGASLAKDLSKSALQDATGNARRRLENARTWLDSTGLPRECYVLNGRVETSLLNMQRQLMMLASKEKAVIQTMIQRRVLTDRKSARSLGSNGIHSLVMKHTGALPSYHARILAPLQARGGNPMW